MEGTKFCKHCGETIDKEAVVCIKCGKQVEELAGSKNGPQININNVNSNSSVNGIGKKCDKVVALLLCIFLGYLGAHKFYEGKVGMGIVYIFTAGLCGVGVVIDFIALLTKPSTYYV